MDDENHPILTGCVKSATVDGESGGIIYRLYPLHVFTESMKRREKKGCTCEDLYPYPK